ncbi:HNH endonuclease [Arenibacter sp. TNZ]|nr:HNH endonuclease [Arenibacter sp. TNZ]
MGWSEDELRASVQSYLEIQTRTRQGENPIKKRYYENLSQKYGRTIKAYEYRMQNISYVMLLQGREWISGLAPMSNVGANIAEKLENIIADIEKRNPNPIVAFEAKVKSAIGKMKLTRPNGRQKPNKNIYLINDYERDFMVKAWVLKNADGCCESCNKKAPFETIGGLPYLEVHHVLSLAEGGSDKVENTVAVCPNCHREAHYGTFKTQIKDAFYANINRLVVE